MTTTLSGTDLTLTGALSFGNTWSTYTPTVTGLGNCTVTDGPSGRYLSFGATTKMCLITLMITFSGSGTGTFTVSFPSSFFTNVYSITGGAGHGLGYSGALVLGGATAGALSTTTIACAVLSGSTSNRVRVCIEIIGD